MIQTEYCYYQEAMLLKKLGYDERCDKFYEDLITYKGKPISFEEQLDLVDQGLAKEIKREAGGSLSTQSNRNSDDWLGETCCSCPTLSQALRWLREHEGWHIEAYPSTEYKWHVWIVSLGELNPEDGKLNACDMEGKEYPTYETALHVALRFQLKCWLKAKEEAKKFIKKFQKK